MLESLLLPETSLERTLLQQEPFINGLMWGEPRFGHPEGRVALHVREVLDNINRIPNLQTDQRRQLRIIAYAHDTFKYAEDRSRPRDWSRHHASLARKYLEKFTDDTIVLDIVESHDDAFYAWLCTRHQLASPDGRVVTLEDLQQRLAHCLQIFYLFFKCDTQTGDKTQAPLKWFEETAVGIEVVPIRETI